VEGWRIYTIHPLVNTGPSANRVDIVFMGDGYTSSEIATTYASQVSAFVDYLFDGSLLTEPFGRYRSFFNVYAIDVISSQSGADHPAKDIFRNTALNASYSFDGVTDRLLYIDESAAGAVESETLSGTHIGADLRFVVVNDSTYGGGGGQYGVYAGANDSAREIALHEIAHSFVGLADEYGGGTRYVGDDPLQPNVTTDPDGAKWAEWIGYEQPGIGPIGAYEGGLYQDAGIFRPSENSKMRSLEQPFDAVARERFILAFYDLVDPLDGFSANEGALRNPAGLSVDAIDPEVIRVDWTVGARTFVDHGETLSFDFDDFGFGTYAVAAHAYDPTDWVRSDRSSLEQSVTWTVVNDRRLIGGARNDILSGNALANEIEGRVGNDLLLGGAGADTLLGGGGHDRLDGGPGPDILDGGPGNDTYRVDDGGDSVLESGIGTDTVVASVSYALTAWARVETLRTPSTVAKSPLTLKGSSAANTILGNSGPNKLDGKGGADRLYGYGGNDVYHVDHVLDRVIESGVGRDTVIASTSYALSRTVSVEVLRTSSAAATSAIDLTGSSIANAIAGNAGVNVISGKGGNDRLTGGRSKDAFVFDTPLNPSTNVDRIMDFVARDDTVRLDDAVFATLTRGALAASALAFGAAAADLTDRIVYDRSTGSLFYDADGLGGGEQVKFATLPTRPFIGHLDFVVI
jgi:Ca2+-binding RTX toxin-like protein